MKRGPELKCNDQLPAFNWRNSDIESEREDNPLYAYITEKIAAAKIQAIKNNKPLLILFGEGHGEIFSSIVEIVSITAAIQLGFKCFCLELDDIRYDLYLKNVIPKLQRQNGDKSELHLLDIGGSISITPLFFQQIELPVFLIDKGCDNSLNSESFDEDEMRKRNKMMAEELKKFSEDTFAIVGSNHLYGLRVEESSLTDYFEIVEFNAIELPLNAESEYDQLCENHLNALSEDLTKLFKVDKSNLRNASFYSPIRDHFIKRCKESLLTPQKVDGLENSSVLTTSLNNTAPMAGSLYKRKNLKAKENEQSFDNDCSFERRKQRRV